MADATDTTTLPAGQAKSPSVFTRDGAVFASSRDVAGFFGKRHDDVIRRVRALLKQEPSLALRTFAEGYYMLPGTGSQQHVYFDMTRDGFALLAMGFTGEKALRFKLAWIDAFNRMEAELRGTLPDAKAVAVRGHTRAAPRRALPQPSVRENQAIMRIAGEVVLVDLTRIELGPEERAVCIDGLGALSIEAVILRQDPHNPRIGVARVPRPVGQGLARRGVQVVGAVIGTLPLPAEEGRAAPKRIAGGKRPTRRAMSGHPCSGWLEDHSHAETVSQQLH